VTAYAVLKRTLAAHYRGDRDGYCRAKSDFIEAPLAGTKATAV